MKKLFLYTFIIITFNLTLLIIPLLLFLLCLSVPSTSFFEVFHWFYLPFVIASPILVVILGYRIYKMTHKPWIPPLMSWIGFSPIWLSYLMLTTPWNYRDMAIVLLTPLLLGLIAYVLAEKTIHTP